MRVVFLAHHPSIYGANRSLVDLILGLRHHDVEACVVAPPGGRLAKSLSELDVPTLEMQLPWWVSRHRTAGTAFLHLGMNVKALTRLAFKIRAWDPDIVYSNSSFIPSGVMIGEWLDLPHVWHLREFIDLDWGLTPDWGWKAFQLLANRCDAIIAVSDAVRRHLLRGPAAERAHVIHSGVAPRAEFDRLREEAHSRKRENAPYTFALVGVLSPTKAQDIAISALAQVVRKVPDVRLLIAGSGNATYQAKCVALVQRLGLEDSVVFLGYAGDPFRVYLDADAVLMCSKYEAQGRVTLEAMAACRPVIGHNQGGTAEIVDHERTGLLYDDGPDGLASCMLRFVENPEWAAQMGERGWQVAAEKYTLEVCAEQVYRILDKLVQN